MSVRSCFCFFFTTGIVLYIIVMRCLTMGRYLPVLQKIILMNLAFFFFSSPRRSSFKIQFYLNESSPQCIVQSSYSSKKNTMKFQYCQIFLSMLLCGKKQCEYLAVNLSDIIFSIKEQSAHCQPFVIQFPRLQYRGRLCQSCLYFASTCH